MKAYLLILSVLLITSSCKKDKPEPPSKDFREKYVGTFRIKKMITNSKSLPPDYKIDADTTYLDLECSVYYKISDSTNVYFNTVFVMPALVFDQSDGKVWHFGVDSSGRIYYNPTHTSLSTGGFIGTDSIHCIFHSYDKYSNGQELLTGTRIK